MTALLVALLVSTSTQADCAIALADVTAARPACSVDELRELYTAEREARLRWQATAKERKEYLETTYGKLLSANKTADLLRVDLATKPQPERIEVEPKWPAIAIGAGAVCASIGAYAGADMTERPLGPLLGAGLGSAACALLVAGTAEVIDLLTR